MVWWGGRSWKGGGSGRGGACGGLPGDVGVVGLGSVADGARVLLTRSHSVEGSGPCLDVGVFVLIRAFLPKCAIDFIYTAGSPTGTPPSPVALPALPLLPPRSRLNYPAATTASTLPRRRPGKANRCRSPFF
jgi:hypothetical protein